MGSAVPPGGSPRLSGVSGPDDDSSPRRGPTARSVSVPGRGRSGGPRTGAANEGPAAAVRWGGDVLRARVVGGAHRFRGDVRPAGLQLASGPARPAAATG